MTSSSGVDVLFEQNPIAEIVKIEAKIRADIEKKKTDLRQMVGERYMDLIEAADTVDNMEHAANAIPAYIAELKKHCHEFRNIHFSQPVHNEVNDKRNDVVYASVSFLINSPSHLYALLQENDALSTGVLWTIVERTYRFCLSSDIKDQIEIIVNQHWSIVFDLKTRIKSSALKKLCSSKVDKENLFDYLCVCMLLDNNSLAEAVDSLFKSLEPRIRESLQQEHKSTKENLSNSVSMFMHSLIAVFEVFYQSSPVDPHPFFSLQFPQRITKILDNIFKPISCSGVPVEYLSNIDILLSPLCITEDITDQVERLCKTFVEAFATFCEQQLPIELSYVDSCKALGQIYSSLKLGCSNDRDLWLLVVQVFNLNIPDVFENLFRLPICNRCSGLLSDSLDSISTDLITSLEDYSKKDSRGLNETHNAAHQHLETLAKKYVRSFDASLKSVCEDESFILQAIKDDPDSERAIRMTVLTAVEAAVKKLITYVQFCIDQQCSDNLTYCVLSHVCDLIWHHCPNLWNLLDGKQCSTEMDKLASMLADYKEMAADQSVSLIIRGCIKDLETKLKESCSSTSGMIDFMLSSTLAWSEHEIEEEGEGGEKVKSTIQYPSNPSISLQNTMFLICDNVRLVFGHTLSKKVAEDSNQTMINHLLAIYAELEVTDNVDKTHTGLIQRWALQCLFDVKWLMAVRSPPSNPEVNRRFAEICAKLEKHIDPFDLNVFLPHIDKSVNVAAETVALLFGVIIPDIVIASSSNRMLETTSHQVIPMGAVGVARFSMLPTTQWQSSATIPVQCGSGLSSNTSEEDKVNSKIPPTNLSTSFYQKMTTMSSSWFNA